MSKKLNHSLAVGIFLIGILFSSISEGFSQTTNYFTWNNSTTNWSTTTAWNPTGGPQTASSTTNTNVAIFAAVGAGNNTVLLGSDRTVYGLIFTNGANAYTFGSVSAAKQLDILNGIGLQNVSGQNQIFNLSVANVNGNGFWTNSAGSTTTFNSGLNLTSAGSSTSRDLTLGGAGTWNVASSIANGGTSTAGKVIVTARGTTTFSGNNTYDGRTTMNAAGGTLTLSGNNSGAAGGVTLTAGTLNLNNANAVGTGVLDLGVVTGSSVGSSIINNTSGGALTYSGLSGVTWSGVATNATGGAGIQFGTSGSSSANNMDFGTGLVTAGTDRNMTIAGTNVTISMGILNVIGKGAAYAFKIEGTGNTIDFDGWRIGAATDQDKAAIHELKGSANVTMGTIVNGTPGTNGITYANGVGFNSDGVTRLTGNNTYTGTTEFKNGNVIISGNNSAAVGNVTIAGSVVGKFPVVRLDTTNAISSSSSLLGFAGSDKGGTLALNGGTNYVLNAFLENSMNFTNSYGQNSTLTFTNANNVLTSSTGSAGSRNLLNHSADLNIVFDGNMQIGSTSFATGAGVNHTIGGSGNWLFKGNLTNSAGIRGLEKTGTGTLELRGTGNSYTGTTEVDEGTLNLSGSLTGSTSLLVSKTNALSNASRGTATLNVANGASLLSGSTTTVYSGGNLIVDGTAGAVVVGANGLLGGSGTVGTTTVAGILTPGNSPGVLNVNGNLTMASGGNMIWELFANTATQASPAVFDQVLVSGNLDFAGSNGINLNFGTTAAGSTVSWSDSFWNSNQSFLIYDVAGSTAGFSNLSLLNTSFNDATGAALAESQGSFSVSQLGSDVFLNYNAIPEPSTGSMLGLGFAGLVVTRLLRRKIS